MTTNIVTKSLGMMEDLEVGINKVTQVRNQIAVTGNRVYIPVPVDSDLALANIDVSKYTYAIKVLGLNQTYYVYDATAISGDVASVTGTGYWIAVGLAELQSYLAGKGDALIAVKQPMANAKNTTQHDLNALTINLANVVGGDPDNSDTKVAFQSALDYLNTKGGGTLHVTQPGVYLFNSEILLYSNITINLNSGVILKKNYAGGVFFRINPNSAQNISVVGGIIDGNGQTYSNDAFDIFAVTGGRNLLFRDTTYLDVVDFHALDLANCYDVLVHNCKFLGFKQLADRNYSEAIQLDPSLESAGAYLQNKNITVDNCYFGPNPNNSVAGFTSWGAGVGNHANNYGNQDENIRILNCRFDNMLFGGVRVFNWKDWVVSNCRFSGGIARGVHVTPYPSATRPQGSRNGRIVNNHFENVRGPILIAAPTWPFTDISDAFHEDITIANNTIIISETLGNALDIRWCSGLTVTNNVASGGVGFLAGRFINNAVIANNQYNGATNTGIWLAETDATTFIGTGLTNNVVVANNVLQDLPIHGIQVNCKAYNVNIANNIIKNAATGDATNNYIRVDSAAVDVLISNNACIDGSATIKPNVGIQATGSCSNINMIGNKSLGTAATHNNQGTGNSSVVVFGGSGAPTSSSNAIGAPVGSLYTRVDGAANTSLYIKESGTSSAGWIAK